MSNWKRVTKLFGALTVCVVVGAACGSGSSSDSADSGGSEERPIVATDVAAQAGAGFDEATFTHGENCVSDLDGDSVPDILLSKHQQAPWLLLRGLPDGRFEPWKGLDLERSDRHGCAVADYNADGLLDVYISVGGCEGQCEGPKELWIQQPDHSFVNEAAQWGIDDPGGRGRVPVALNANGDDLPDLFTGQEEGVKYPSPNRLWINKGDRFALQEGPQTNDLGNLCSAAADIDGDGLDEIAMCTTSNGFFMFRNEGGTYVEATDDFGMDDYGRLAVEFGDLNGDDRPDLVTVARKRVQVHLNDGGKYGEPSFELEVAEGMDIAFGDADGDGDLDLYVKRGAPERDVVLLNDGEGNFTIGTELPLPRNGAAGPGGGAVVAIPDWKGTGRAAFVVNNGKRDSVGGNRQLFEFTER